MGSFSKSQDSRIVFKITINTKEGILCTIGEAIAQGHPQIGFVISSALTYNDYKEVRNSIIIENISRRRGDFIVNPRPAEQQDFPVVRVTTLEELEEARRKYVRRFVVQVPKSVHENTRSAIMSTARFNDIVSFS